jgi:hypothetical protein
MFVLRGDFLMPVTSSEPQDTPQRVDLNRMVFVSSLFSLIIGEAYWVRCFMRRGLQFQSEAEARLHVRHSHCLSRAAVVSSSCIVRFEDFTAVTMKNGVFWDVTPRGSCKN